MIVLLFFPIWGLECKGSIFTVIVLTFLVGFCGLMHGKYSTQQRYKKKYVVTIQKLLEIKVIIYVNIFVGFIISVMCKDHTMANYCSAGSFYPLIVMSGESLFFLFFAKIIFYFNLELSIVK